LERFLVGGNAVRYFLEVMPGAKATESDLSAGLRACAYTPLLRIAGGVLVALSGASLPAILVLGMLSPVPVPLAAWVRALVAFAAAPAVLAVLIRRALTVDVEVHEAELVVHRRGLRLQIPATAIERIVPWTIPLPGPGFWLRMRSGRRLSYGLQAPDPSSILSALAATAAVEAAQRAMRHATLVYASAKHGGARWRWYHIMLKFVAFALLPAAVWFNLTQHVTFGGLFGQYYLEGLGAYLKTFAIHWGLVTVYLILYASVWRGLAEAASLLVAWLSPGRAARVRWLAEGTCRLLYYVGVPVIVALPFLR
jgi:hypothetical protein